MKLKEKQISRKLRKQGWSINEIHRKFGFAKGSVSLWVRDIELTPKQKQRLSKKGIKKEVIEKRRATRLKNEKTKKQIIINIAEKNINHLSKRELFLIGVSLYWAEGGKTGSIVRFSNSDPAAIKIMMKFFRDICKIPESKFRGYIHIHPHLSVKKAEKYWSDISRISLKQFYKTYNKINKASKNKKDSLPFGTFDVYICSTELFLKIKGWTNGIIKAKIK